MSNLVGDARAAVSAADLTVEQALEIINGRHARMPMMAEQVFVFRMSLSNQEIDAYQTRMAITSLRNYEADFKEGRAFMNSHHTGGWLGAGELPMGRIFDGVLTGEPLPDKARYEDKGGATLMTHVYVQRGLKLTDVSTDDFIKGVEGGTVRDVSIGFSLSDGGMYRCSVCGGDLMDWGDEGCQHIPGVTYEEGRAFAWVDNARAREGSAMYCHATPQTYIDKAIRLADAGKLERREALRLEEEWGARIVSGRSFVVPKKDSGAVREAEIQSGSPAPAPDSVEWSAVVGDLRAVDPGLADAVWATPPSGRGVLLARAVNERNERARDLKARADLGDKWIESLIGEVLVTRTRAEGVGKFDAEKYAEVLRKADDPDFIKGEIDSWKRRAQGVFGDGSRPTSKAASSVPLLSARAYGGYRA